MRLRAFVALLFLAGPGAAGAADLVVSAAASLTDAFQAVGKSYEAKHPGTHVVLNFAASDVLLRQIANGAPADVFASADQAAMDKAVAELIVRAAGVPTPDFVVIRSARDLPAVKLPYPLFVKPLAEGTSKGVRETSRVEDRAQLTARALEVLKTYRQPALVETFLPGREFTVGILGAGINARAIGVSEIHFLLGGDPSAYSYKNKMEAFDELTLATGPLAEHAGSRRVDLQRHLVGLELDERLVGLHGLARLLEPLADRGLGDGFAEGGYADFGRHVRPLLSRSLAVG